MDAPASAAAATVFSDHSSKQQQSIELGTIDYCNLTMDGRHGDFHQAIQVAAVSGKPMFVNFVEWSGCRGCQDAGRAIFANPDIQRVVEQYFVPCAFNTWDRHNPKYVKAFQQWSSGLEGSCWGYVRIVDPSKNQILSKTQQITGGHGLSDVKRCIREALEKLGVEVPLEMC